MNINILYKMKKIFSLLLLLLFVAAASYSCSNQTRRSRKPVSNINILPAARNYIYGTTVAVKVETKLRNGEIDNVKLFLNGKLLEENESLNFTVDGIKLDKLGNNNFHVVATKTDNVSNTRTSTFTVFSDIVPKTYTYKTLNHYPHNKHFFTQGLEFHDGFLYEGTGEHGTSGLFKVNLQTGKPVMQHMLDVKYFGEGITILDDKVYQLTYRAQKGFVYNLDDFAVIDSFSYKSNEGWGLTNDGQYLIMSNGTHELIWLDPADYSEVKRVDVANNLGLINNINELEYINETIFANIWTTNMIVQIETETGKVLSQVNLDGILNMYTNPTDTIDVLNGIAYDSISDRIFITGKKWPRLFEIELFESE
jgi:glutaminyl-peptide cyclotransferase